MGESRKTKIGNIVCAVLVIITVSVFTVTLAQNIILRSPEALSFYLNDTRVVNSISTTKTVREISDEFGDYLIPFKTAEFQIYEDTGYDLQPLFTEDERYNMLRIHRGLDQSLVICALCGVISVLIYIYLLRQGRKRLLFDMHKITIVTTIALTLVQMALVMISAGREWLVDLLGLVDLPEKARLLTLFGGSSFITMMSVFITALSLIVLGVITYVCRQLTREEKMFE